MDAFLQPIVVDSRREPAAECLVCGQKIGPGEGVSARYQGETLRFKCLGCYDRFVADPYRYLAGQSEGCCDEVHGATPAAELTQHSGQERRNS